MAEKSRELYQDEIDNLKAFRQKIDTKAIFKEDLDDFSNYYEELIAQAKVITRVSDRLQKKLDNANIQIQDQNVEIKDKNLELGTTLDQLAKAKVGKRASTILYTVAIGIFIVEQVFLEPLIEQKLAEEEVNVPYIGLMILAVLFILVKLLESSLEGYFMKKEKKRILEKEKSFKEDAKPAFG
ncbi:MAG: hypothetical protein AAGA85_02725 [Bacteroidota bacterium]